MPLEPTPQRQVAAYLTPRGPRLGRDPRTASRDPSTVPTSSEAASTRESSPSSCDRAATSSTSAARFSPTDMNTGSTGATPFNDARRSTAHSTIGCSCSTGSTRAIQSHLLARTSLTTAGSGAER